jgi:phosphate uptake regulator
MSSGGVAMPALKGPNVNNDELVKQIITVVGELHGLSKSFEAHSNYVKATISDLDDKFDRRLDNIETDVKDLKTTRDKATWMFVGISGVLTFATGIFYNWGTKIIGFFTRQ